MVRALGRLPTPELVWSRGQTGDYGFQTGRGLDGEMVPSVEKNKPVRRVELIASAAARRGCLRPSERRSWCEWHGTSPHARGDALLLFAHGVGVDRGGGELGVSQPFLHHSVTGT